MGGLNERIIPRTALTSSRFLSFMKLLPTLRLVTVPELTVDYCWRWLGIRQTRCQLAVLSDNLTWHSRMVVRVQLDLCDFRWMFRTDFWVFWRELFGGLTNSIVGQNAVCLSEWANANHAFGLDQIKWRCKLRIEREEYFGGHLNCLGSNFPLTVKLFDCYEPVERLRNRFSSNM